MNQDIIPLHFVMKPLEEGEFVISSFQIEWRIISDPNYVFTIETKNPPILFWFFFHFYEIVNNL